MALATSDKTFTEDALQSAVPVLVDFWAPWCGPCKIAGPIIDGIAIKMAGKAKVFKLNVDENPATANQYGITGIPTVLIFKSGEMVQQLVGVQQEKVYLEALGRA